jgi:deoxyribodipyrimidine photo-lyase
MVDAGMRELWQTGWMHNRVRMITASYLVKNLLHPWQQGERWFWETLVDADLASNALNWQWVAGTSPDASPWFRVFNPDTQAEKFDPDGTYRRSFVPEAGTAGYISPITDLKSSRQRALDAYAALRKDP